MTAKKKIEVFSAGCLVCEETIALVNRIACPSCEVASGGPCGCGRGQVGKRFVQAGDRPLGRCGWPSKQ